MEREPVASLGVDRLRDADAAGPRHRFQPRGDIDAVPHEVVAFDDDVAEVDPDAKTQLASVGEVGVPLGELELDLGGTPHCLDGTRELGNNAVSGAAEDAPFMAPDQPVDEFATRPELRKRAFLILADQPAV